MPVPFFLEELEKACEAGLQLEHRVRRALEERPPLGRHRARIVEVLLEEQRGVARVESVDLRPGHSHRVVAACPGYQSGCEVMTAIIIPRKKQAATVITAAKASR